MLGGISHRGDAELTCMCFVCQLCENVQFGFECHLCLFTWLLWIPACSIPKAPFPSVLIGNEFDMYSVTPVQEIDSFMYAASLFHIPVPCVI